MNKVNTIEVIQQNSASKRYLMYNHQNFNNVQPTHSHKSSIMVYLNLVSPKVSEMHDQCDSGDSVTSIVHMQNCLVEF